jgi:hypothetical protein
MDEEKKPLPVTPHDDSGILEFDWLLNQFKSLVVTIWDMLKDFLLFIVDLLMDAGIAFIDGFASTLKLIDLSQYLVGIPPDVSFVIGAVGLGKAISIIMIAGTARLLMQLIPFVRLGS